MAARNEAEVIRRCRQAREKPWPLGQGVSFDRCDLTTASGVQITAPRQVISINQAISNASFFSIGSSPANDLPSLQKRFCFDFIDFLY